MDSNGILSVVAIVTSVGGAVLAVINHTRVRSNCFGHKLEVSLDVSKTTPSPPVDLEAQTQVQTVPEASPPHLKISIPKPQYK
jgi:hypothetical protein